MKIKDLGEPIYGVGNLFEWGEKQILKLYGPEVPREIVKQLEQKEKGLFEMGLPVPQLGELIEIEDSLGQVYERIEGMSLGDELMSLAENAEERIDELANIFAETHYRIHSCKGFELEMHHQKEFFPVILQRVEILSDEIKEELVNTIKILSDGNRICHGDFHPFNVVLSPKGPIVIDWNNSHVGNPLEDVARSKLILVGHTRMYPQIGKQIDRFRDAYIDRYFQLQPEGRDQISEWWPIVSAVRFLDNIPELQDWLLEQVKVGIKSGEK